MDYKTQITFTWMLAHDLQAYLESLLPPVVRHWIVVDSYGDEGRQYLLAYQDSDDPNGPYVIDDDFAPFLSKGRAKRVMMALNDVD